MRLYDIAFYASGFFLVGVLIYSFKLSLLIIAVAAAFAAVLFFLSGYLEIASSKSFWFAALSLLIAAGAFYSLAYDFYQNKKINVVFGEKINFSGVIIENPDRGASQNLTIDLSPPYSGRVLVQLSPYPTFSYGDEIKLQSVIQAPEPANYADYLAKDAIWGIVKANKAELIAQNKGFALLAALFKFKDSLILNFQKILSSEQAAFLSGLTVGERAEFSPEFKNAIKQSGTTHLVALSGYNVSIIAVAIAGLFGWFLSRRWSFALSILVIVGFVLMTGAEASVVRAAIMGTIMMFASQIGRIYSSRNAIAIAALLMVLANPKILRFDVGFQLSFLALAGMIYLAPAIKNIFRIEDNKNFLSLQENLLNTASAQLAVAPFLVLYFGGFSLISLVSNILVLGFIPLTMALGFIAGFVGFFSYHLSQILGWLVSIFLSYEILIIKFFGSLNILRIESLSLALAVFYYLALVFIILRFGFKNLEKI